MTDEPDQYLSKLWKELFEVPPCRRAEKMPTEESALGQLHEAYLRLQDLGWRDAVYCPKDGTMFWGISPDCSRPYKCQYVGQWPKGSWFCFDGIDAWPCYPVLFKLFDGSPKEKA